MRNGSMEQQTVEQVMRRDPSVSATLREYGIDPTNRMNLATAAAAVSAHPDALLAEIEYRMRRQARAQARQAQNRRAPEGLEVYEEELALA
jgi:hypothetical protein